jgi:septum formation protein
MPTQIILASASPRRHQLLAEIVPEFTICPADLDEDALTTADPFETAKLLAIAKAKSVLAKNPSAIVIGSDTVVAYQENEAWIQLTKPTDETDALRILKLLQGRKHTVITGIAIISETLLEADFESAEVHFKATDDDLLREYILTGEPMDKAGAYGAQGMGAFLVEKIVGSVNTVIGLPIELTKSLLAKHLM